MTAPITVSVVIPAFDNGDAVARALGALSSQRLPLGIVLNIVVVDDGSPMPIETALTTHGIGGCRVIRHAQNRGRAAARNTGAFATDGNYLMFLDADCRPAESTFVAAHLACLDTGVDLSFGRLDVPGISFWARYQREISERRARALRSGDFATQTVANFTIRRTAFSRAGGFDEHYKDYGFEDMDFLLRLRAAGVRAGLAQDAVFVHDAELDLAGVCGKMETAGRSTSERFRRDHPTDYARLHYSRVDARERRMLGVAGEAATALLPRLIRTFAACLEARWLPYAIRRRAVQGACALAYLKGTRAAVTQARGAASAIPPKSAA